MILGIVGLAGSGKDTVGDILQLQGFKRESFAKPLKDAVSAIFGWNRDKLEGTNKIDRDWREIPDEYWSQKIGKRFTPRLALQLMGTEVGREVFHPNLWIDALERRVQQIQKMYPYTNFVITDVRFNNEIEMITRIGGLCVRIHRGKTPKYWNDAIDYNSKRKLFASKDIVNSELQRFPSSLQGIHISEWDWIGNSLIKNEIDNNGTLDDLAAKVTTLVNKYVNHI